MTIHRALQGLNAVQLTQEERVWRDLGSEGESGAKAFNDFAKLGAKMIPQIRRNLLRVAMNPPTAKEIDQLVSSLDSGVYKERAAAHRALDTLQLQERDLEMAPLVRTALQLARSNGPSLELTRRLDRLESSYSSAPVSQDNLRMKYSMVLLGQLNTRESRALLRLFATRGWSEAKIVLDQIDPGWQARQG